MLEEVSKGEASLLLATHNFESAKLAAGKAEELGIMRRGQAGLQFAQLKGMSDTLLLGLVKAGFEVSKYLAFGPVEQVLPYLIRRAEENRGMLSTTPVDIDRLMQGGVETEDFTILTARYITKLHTATEALSLSDFMGKCSSCTLPTDGWDLAFSDNDETCNSLLLT